MKLVKANKEDSFSVTFENGIENPTFSINGMTFNGGGVQFAHEGDLLIALGEYLINKGIDRKNLPSKRFYFSDEIEGFNKGDTVTISKAP